MKKRTKWTVCLLAAFLFATLIMLLNPEYGDSYSERQRELWNQREVMFQWHENPHRPESVTRSKKREQAKQESALLQQTEAPRWVIDIHIPSDPAQLPLEGLTYDELVQSANIGRNADACLLLAREIKCSSYMTYLSRREWLQKAVELKRPGAEFLLKAAESAFLEKGPELSSSVPFNAPFPYDTSVDYLLQLPGYDDFRSLILSGDSNAYKVLADIDPDILDSSLSRDLEEAMNKRARQGNIAAQRILGELGLCYFSESRHLTRAIDSEVLSPIPASSRHPVTQWLNRRIPIGWKSKSDIPSLGIKAEYAEWLCKAADQGDKQAMFLWLDEGIKCTPKMDERSWKAVFKYADILLKAGYVPFRGRLDVPHWDGMESGLTLLTRYYHPDDIRRLQHQYSEKLAPRGKSWSTLMEELFSPWEQGKSDYYKQIIDEIKFQDSSLFYMVEDIYDNGKDTSLLTTIHQYDPALFDYIFSIMVDAADNKGDPYALLALGHIAFSPKIPYPQNRRQAIDRYEQVFNILFNGRSLRPSQNDLFTSSLLKLQHNMIMIYLDPASDLFDPNRAHRISEDFYEAAWTGINNVFFFEGKKETALYMGLMHEMGYGTPTDPEKAAWYYNQTNQDPHSIDFDIEVIEKLRKNKKDKLPLPTPQCL